MISFNKKFKLSNDNIDSALGVFNSTISSIGNVKSAKLNAEATKKASENSLKKAELESESKIREAKLNLEKAKFQQPQPQKTFSSSVLNKKNLIGFGKDFTGLLKDRGVDRHIKHALVTGALAVGSSYAVDKAIQRNMKRSGLKLAKPTEYEGLTEEEIAEIEKIKKSKRRKKLLGAAAGTLALAGGTLAAKKGAFGDKPMKWVNNNINKKKFKDAAKFVGKTVGENFVVKDEETGKYSPNYLGAAFTLGSAALPILRYKMAKDDYKNQLEASKRRNRTENGEEERSYSLVDSIKKKYLVGKILAKKAIKSGKEEFKEFKKNPGQVALGIVSKIKGGGGRKEVNRFARDLRKVGEISKNPLTEKIGKFAQDNKKTALLASLGGAGIIATLGGLGAKYMNKGLRTLDKNAFAYQERGFEPDNSYFYDEENNEETKNKIKNENNT